MVKPSTNWLTQVADTKYVGYGEKAAFKVKQEGIRAFIQAKGATPARSKIAHKQVTLDTIAVSARPVINTYELKTGRVQMADLIRDAANEMSQKEIEHIQTVLHTAAANWSTPFYGTGSGIVKTVLNPMIQHWMRTGAVSLLGDIAIISKLAEQTGFTASTTTQQYSPSIIDEYVRSGVIGTYYGAKVVNLVNPYLADNVTPQIDTKKLYILPNLLPAAKEPLEAEYQALAVRLCARHQAREEEISGQYRERIAYYTLWAHQIKTPIAAMGLTLQNQDTALSRQLMGQLTRISQYADMALAYLRLDSEHTDYVIRSCDLDAVIREAVKKFSGEFIRRGIHLEYKGVNQKVITDEKWLEFVLEQLISNALKYTPAGSVAIYQEPGPTLCVADTGIGIAPEDLPRIFENGYTGINGRRDKRASGIGLYLCRRVCQNLGHEISAESTPGKGTTIRLNLARRESTYE